MDSWFSADRMHTFSVSAGNTGCGIEELYVWNSRISKAFLEDIGHVEVLLRNFMSRRLAADCGHEDWYRQESHFVFESKDSAKFSDSITAIERRICHDGNPVTPGRVVAAMSLGSWCFLQGARLEHSVWKALRDPKNGGMPYYRSRNRAQFERHCRMMLGLRNRLSHQEHIVLDDLTAEKQYLDEQAENLDWIARAIDPKAADWIRRYSRIPQVRSQRPISQRNSIRPR